MRERKRKFLRVGCVLWMVFLSFIMVASPALAIEDPDTISIERVRVFENIFEDGDWLFVVRYKVEYTTDPDPPASETFLIALYDTDGTTHTGYQRELNYYGHNVIGVYLTASEASAFVWGSEYAIKVMGNPSIFGELVEGVNMATSVLDSQYSYISGDMDTSRGLLGQFCVDIALVLETDWGVDLLTSENKLNDQGAITFNMAIPGLNTVCSSIYETSVVTPILDTVERTVTLEGTISGTFTADEAVVGGSSTATGTFIAGSQTSEHIQVTHSTVILYQGGETATGGDSGETIVISRVIVGALEYEATTRTGTRLTNALNNFGAWLGMSGGMFGGIALFMVFGITAGVIFTTTGSTHGAILLGIPVLLLGNFMGLLPFAITWLLVAGVALLFAVLFIMGRFA